MRAHDPEPSTMGAVAQRAGVSKATVSRVLHSPEIVRPATRDRVTAAMQELGYVYNSVAADFKRQKNSMIGLVAFTVRNSILADMILGIKRELENTRFSLVIGDSDHDPDAERRILRLFRERKLSGVILAGSTDANTDAFYYLSEAGIPVVITWEVSRTPSLHSIGIDNYDAARRVCGHLVSLGHRRIAMIAGPATQIHRVRRRIDGFRDELTSHGVEVPDEYVLQRKPTPAEGEAAMQDLLALDPRPTAVFAASDAFALGAIHACTRAGLRVPDDISIAGFDDAEFARYLVPALTTVHVPSLEMGRLAAQSVLAQQDTTTTRPTQTVLETTLIVRDSTAPPPDEGLP